MAHIVHVVDNHITDAYGTSAWRSTWYAGDGAEQAARSNCGEDGRVVETTPYWVVRGGIWRSDRLQCPRSHTDRILRGTT